ncbi:deoxyhypusine synthase [Leptolyngbya sp. PCC 7375]|nr:deoxyhypusine synthase [Leptolyngbya sp. PCC 7375]
MDQSFQRKIAPAPLPPEISVVDLIDNYFTAYNSARLREICHLLTKEVMQPDVTVGVSLSGAMTPAGFGVGILSPLIRQGYIDWMVSTGANLYHDLHSSLGMNLYASSPFLDDVTLRKQGHIRIYDIIFDYDVLLETDAFIRKTLQAPEFQKQMGTAEFHYHLGRYIWEIEQNLGIEYPCLLSTAYECGVPIYTSSPGDSSIGMNVAAMALDESKLILDPAIDVNETAAIVYGSRNSSIPGLLGKSAAIMIGGGSPKNFLLQTQPHIHEVLNLEERGHDYFIQITDARPDTGGLSGATPSEAVSWGKVDPNKLPNSIVCYADSTIALPLISSYVSKACTPRHLKHLYSRRHELVEHLKSDYQAQKNQRNKQSESSVPVSQPSSTPLEFLGQPYIDPEFFARELRHVWHHSWQCVARDEDIPEPGDYVTCTLGQEPIIVLRASDGSLKAMHNICRHRGSTLLEGQGNCQNKIVCPYHAWTYGLNGQLLGITKPQLFQGLDTLNIQLIPAQVDSWNGFIFVNPDAEGESLADYLAEMPCFLEQYSQDWSSLREIDRWFYDEPVNWKLIVENYVEDYHFDVVHDRSFKSLYDLDNIKTLPTGRHIRILVPYNRQPPDGFYQKIWEAGQVSCQGYIFPNMMVNTEKEHVSVFLLTPLDAGHTRVEVIIYQSPSQCASLLYQREELRKEFDEFMEEDFRVCRQIQANISSQAYQVTALANMHESGIIHFHSVLSEYL